MTSATDSRRVDAELAHRALLDTLGFLRGMVEGGAEVAENGEDQARRRRSLPAQRYPDRTV